MQGLPDNHLTIVVKWINSIENKLTGRRTVTCFSSDQVTDKVDNIGIPMEYLNDQTVNGLPAHEFEFKKNMPIMMLRNLNPAQGLCNGTRLIAMDLLSNKRLLVARIITGANAGRIVLIPRIELSPEEGLYPFGWVRRQFPVRASFTMTINKSQGQTLQQVGLYLKTQCFAHGQFYVAISRVGNPDHLKIASLPHPEYGKCWATNIVYRQALTGN